MVIFHICINIFRNKKLINTVMCHETWKWRTSEFCVSQAWLHCSITMQTHRLATYRSKFMYKLMVIADSVACHIMLFLPHDAMHKCSLCCRPVPICLSHWWIVSTQLKISSNFLFGLVVPSLIFWPQHQYPIPRGTPSVVAQNTWGWENYAIFDWNCFLSQKLYKKGPWLLWINS